MTLPIDKEQPSLPVRALERMIASVVEDMAKQEPGNYATMGELNGELKGLRAAHTLLLNLDAVPSAMTESDADGKRIADANLKALLTYTTDFYSAAMEHGMKRGETANAIAHVESAARALHRLAISRYVSQKEPNG